MEWYIWVLIAVAAAIYIFGTVFLWGLSAFDGGDISVWEWVLVLLWPVVLPILWIVGKMNDG